MNKELNILVKQETERLKQVINTLSESEINQILGGQRPLRIDYNDFRILRKSYKENIKQYLKHKIKK